MFFLDQSVVLFSLMFVLYRFDFLIFFFAEAAFSRATYVNLFERFFICYSDEVICVRVE